MHGIISDKVYYKHEKEKDKLRMSGGSWSVNLKEIKGRDVKGIVFKTEKNTYSISHDDAYKHGFVRIPGGEEKLVVPLTAWDKT